MARAAEAECCRRDVDVSRSGGTAIRPVAGSTPSLCSATCGSRSGPATPLPCAGVNRSRAARLLRWAFDSRSRARSSSMSGLCRKEPSSLLRQSQHACRKAKAALGPRICRDDVSADVCAGGV
jgi:hypothetical protein